MERPTGRTTLSPWPWSARLAWVGGWRDGTPPQPPSARNRSATPSRSRLAPAGGSPNPIPSPRRLLPGRLVWLPGRHRCILFGNFPDAPMPWPPIAGGEGELARLFVGLPAPAGPSAGVVTDSHADARGGVWFAGRLTFRPGPIGAGAAAPEEPVAAPRPAPRGARLISVQNNSATPPGKPAGKARRKDG